MDLERRRIGLGARPALVLVDLIRGFTDPSCPLGSESASVLEANQKILAVFRRHQLPIFFTTVTYSTADQARILRRRLPALEVLTPGSAWVEVDPVLLRQPAEPLIVRLWPSGFFRTDLAAQLQEAGADSLVVTGLTTSGCVRATALDGLQHEYSVVIPREATGDRNPQAHEANLFDLHAKYADVMPLEEVLAAVAAAADGA